MFEAHRTGLIVGQDAGRTSTTSSGSLTPKGSVASSLPIGIFNPLSGLGGSSDRSAQTQFVAVELLRPLVEAMYAQSWAAAKMIDLPIFDMWVRGRKFQGDEDPVKTMKSAIRKLKAHFNVARAMIAGRLFGSALLIIVEKGKELAQEFDPEKVEKDGIANLWVVDRWSISIRDWHVDVRQPNYGMPHTYLSNSAHSAGGAYPGASFSVPSFRWPAFSGNGRLAFLVQQRLGHILFASCTA